MDIVIFKDGTIPIGVAKLLATDVQDDDTVTDRIEAESGYDIRSYMETFVVDDYPFLLVAWHEDDGFSCFTTGNLAQAFAWLNQDATDKEIAESNLDGKHWALTINAENPDHEWYKHLFIIGDVVIGKVIS